MGAELAATIIGVLIIYRIDKLLNLPYIILDGLTINLPWTLEEYVEKLKIKIRKSQNQLEYDVEASYKDISDQGLRSLYILPKNYIRKLGTIDYYFFYEQYSQLLLFSTFSVLIVFIMWVLESIIPSEKSFFNLTVTWSLFAIVIQMMFMGLAIESKTQLILIGLSATHGFFVASLFTIHSNFGQPLLQIYIDVAAYLSQSAWLSSFPLDEKVFMLIITFLCSLITCVLTVPSIRKLKTYLTASKQQTNTLMLSLHNLEILSPLIVAVSYFAFDLPLLHYSVGILDVGVNLYLFKQHCHSYLNLAKIKTAAVGLISGRTKIQIFRNTVIFVNLDQLFKWSYLCCNSAAGGPNSHENTSVVDVHVSTACVLVVFVWMDQFEPKFTFFNGDFYILCIKKAGTYS